MSLIRSITQRATLVCTGVAAAVLLLTGVEGVLRLLDVGAERGLFTAELAPDGSRIMRLFWNPQFHKPEKSAAERQFLAEKPSGTFRIFVVGESSAEGIPYRPNLAFSSWLEKRLRAQVPDVRWEVVNAALAGATSGSMLAMVRDIARQDPDLLVVYLGHNELGGHLTPEERARLDPDRFDLRAWLARLRLYRIVARALPGPAKRLRVPEVRIPSGSPENYASPADRAVIERLYRARISEMVRVMRRAGAHTALLTLSQNFADWPPVVSVHRSDLGPQELADWQAIVEDGDEIAPDDCSAALIAWRKAGAIDDDYAMLHFKMAGCERRLGNIEGARKHFRLASDLDRFSQGAPLSFNTILREVAQRQGAILVDVDAALTSASGDRLVGDDLFVDPLHPNIRGHQVIAAAVADELRRQGLPVPANRWRADAYVDPHPDVLAAADQELVTKEALCRALACYAARFTKCPTSDANVARLMTEYGLLPPVDLSGEASGGG